MNPKPEECSIRFVHGKGFHILSRPIRVRTKSKMLEVIRGTAGREIVPATGEVTVIGAEINGESVQFLIGPPRCDPRAIPVLHQITVSIPGSNFEGWDMNNLKRLMKPRPARQSDSTTLPTFRPPRAVQ